MDDDDDVGGMVDVMEEDDVVDVNDVGQPVNWLTAVK